MGKQGGLGAALWVGGTDVSGDTQALDISAPIADLDVTDITQPAHSRLPGLRDGAIKITTFWDSLLAHPVYSALPTADVIVTFAVATPSLAVGAPAVCQVSKQVNYDPTRAADGSLTAVVDAVANADGQEWGVLLTPGMRTDTAAVNGTSFDTGGSLAFGGQAYLHAASFAGTDVTVTIQDSADNATFANVTGLSFAQITGSTPLAQRIAIGNTSTIRRYVRAVTTTGGGFTSLRFGVVLNKNPITGFVT